MAWISPKSLSALVLAGCLACLSGSITARDLPDHLAGDSALVLLDGLAPIGTHWGETERLWSAGIEIAYRHFHGPQDLISLAQQVVRHDGRLRQLLSGPATILLSGMAADSHLVVQLQAQEHGVSGLASVLRVTSLALPTHSAPANLAAWQGAVPADPGPSWRTLLAHRITIDGRPALQTIHIVSHAPASVTAQLQARLSRQGWIPMAVRADVKETAVTDWLRAGSHVQLMPGPGGQGTVIYQTLLR